MRDTRLLQPQYIHDTSLIHWQRIGIRGNYIPDTFKIQSKYITKVLLWDEPKPDMLPKSMSGAAMPWLPPPTGNYLELLRKLLKIIYNYFRLLLNYIVEHRNY